MTINVRVFGRGPFPFLAGDLNQVDASGRQGHSLIFLFLFLSNNDHYILSVITTTVID